MRSNAAPGTGPAVPGRAATSPLRRRRWLALGVGALLGGLGGPRVAGAQESLPRLTFAGTRLVSFNLNAGTSFADGAAGDTEFGTVNDFSDSFLLVRLDRQLFEKDRAGLVIGFLFPDVKADLGDVFFNQVQVFYNARDFGGVLGRTRLGNFLVEFPTLREEDLIEYAFVGSGFSNARNSEFSRYGNVLRGELFRRGARLVITGQVANWQVTDLEGAKADDFAVNGVSGSVVYRLPEAIRYAGIVRRAGVGVIAQNVDAPGRPWMAALLGGFALNLTRHPLRNVEFRGQGIYNFGAESPGGELVFDAGEGESVPISLADPVGRARSEFFSLVGSLRFLRRPYQLDRFQAAVTGAYRGFVNREGSHFAVIPNAFFRLGQGVDLGVQYRYERFDGALAGRIGRRRDHSVQLALGFRFQMMFNDYFGERDDILNLEHGYIP